MRQSATHQTARLDRCNAGFHDMLTIVNRHFLQVIPDVGPPWLGSFMVFVRMAFTKDNVEAVAAGAAAAKASSSPEARASEICFMGSA